MFFFFLENLTLGPSSQCVSVITKGSKNTLIFYFNIISGRKVNLVGTWYFGGSKVKKRVSGRRFAVQV